MSELKAVHAFDVYEAYTKTGDDDAAQVYIKSEADKVIAELKAREDVLVTDNRNLLDKVKVLDQRLHENAEHFKRNESQILENAEKELRHHKYKRCLAMALLWLDRAENSTDLENELVSRKRCSKWLELAEKFKGAK